PQNAPLVAHHTRADTPRKARIAPPEALRETPTRTAGGNLGVLHGPYTAWLVARTVAQNSARPSPRSFASHRAVAAARYGALGRPRQGCGVRKGASVSTMRWPSGVSTAAARTSLALRNVAVPAKER